MIALTGRIFKRGSNVAVFKQRIIRKNFLASCSRCEQVKHITNPYAQPTQAGTPAALVRVEGYTVYFAHRR
jgi:hypothetical protein